jgi:hypothetical protein
MVARLSSRIVYGWTSPQSILRQDITSDSASGEHRMFVKPNAPHDQGARGDLCRL